MTTTKSIKSKFKNKNLFDLAITHKSWINENPGIRRSNERIEFLGDAVLELVVSSHLYEKFPDKEEGYLTALRANLVNTQNLSIVAEKIKIGEALFLSKGEEGGGGRKNQSLLADTLESIIGAIYIDRGIKEAENFIKKNVLSGLSLKLKEPLKDAKSRLQEAVQSRGFRAPRYKMVESSGPDHAKRFIIEVYVLNKKLGKGVGKNKSKAEQNAAKSALKTGMTSLEKVTSKR